MIHRKIPICLVLVFLSVAALAGCAVFAQDRSVKFGETFTLLKDEVVRTEDGKMMIRSIGVGRTISEAGETEYVELTVKYNRSERKVTLSERGESRKTIGPYTILLEDADSFGKTSCQLNITRKR